MTTIPPSHHPGAGVRLRRISLALAACASLALAAVPAAHAQPDSAADAVEAIEQALAAEPTALPTVADPTFDDVPAIGIDAATAAAAAQLDLPVTGASDTVGDTAIYDAAGTDAAQVAVQSVGIGTRALIHIEDATAPERYAFDVGGDVARLQVNEDGSVGAFDAAGELVGGFTAPWARDAAGAPVPTRYEVDGTTLTQVVDHRSGAFEYGITADPVWLALAIRACMAVRCYNWMAGYVQRQFLHGHITVAVTAFLRAWFCKQTWIC